jgi:hypothetical protein
MVTSPFWSEWGTAEPNVYALDIIANIIWFSTGRELPADPYRVHEFRMDLYNFGLRKSLLVSLLEFTEKFGALPNREYRKLSEIESTQGEASNAYLTGEYDQAHEKLEAALLGMDELEQVVMVLKDKTLFWVYVVEWSITTSTMLMAGVIVWALMVKRAMYREVGATRASMME